jgi:hypothetical protein
MYGVRAVVVRVETLRDEMEEAGCRMNKLLISS